MNDPALVLADEPTGNLDAESGQEVLRLLRSVADGGCGVVLVTHDVQASELADDVLRIESGKLVA